METEDIEKVVMQQAAAAFVNGMTEETRTTLMNNAVERVLAKTISTYSVEQKIGGLMEHDMLCYVETYLQAPEVQERLEKSAHEAVDRLFKSVVTAMRTDLRTNMKSKYCLFED